MPVTPKFAGHLHDRLGVETTAGLVEWCDNVETAFRLELRDLSEMYFARFDAKLEQRAAQIEARVAQVESRVDQVKAELRQDIANLRAELIKWAFVFFATAALAVIGLR